MRTLIGALLVWLVLCALATAVWVYVVRPRRFYRHVEKAIGLTAPPDAAVINAGEIDLSEREQSAFDDLVRRFHGSFYVPGPEVSDD